MSYNVAAVGRETDVLAELGAVSPRDSVFGLDLEMNATVSYYLSLVARKMKTVRRLLASGDLKTVGVGFRRNVRIITNRVRAIPYYVFADREDRRYDGKCTNRTVASKHYDQGAHDLQNSDYRCIEQLFEAVPLRPDDVFVDVGCGEGVFFWPGDLAKTSAAYIFACGKIEMAKPQS